tara:strand:+ start:2084 stop:3175 length:1092 start_codon:yes stop_codon:yes gene_type:complete
VNPEIHIVVVWEKGLNMLGPILYDLENTFEIVDVSRVVWHKDFFSNNLSRFYGQNLKNKSFKERHCGTGPFMAIVLRDKNVIYELRKTSKGISRVNSRLFDKKQKYRYWTGGGHRVHCSNNLDESKRDLLFMLNKSDADYLNQGSWDGVIRNHDNNILGFNGWNDFGELFKFINNFDNYVFLRNYNNLKSYDNHDSDIDFLTNDLNFYYNINAFKKHKSKYRASYFVKVDNKEYSVDLRNVEDGYYDYKWSSYMISSKVKYNNEFFIPDLENELYSLLYHALIHKYNINSQYINKIKNISDEIGLSFKYSHDRRYLLDFLNKFLNKNGYSITNPADYSVGYNMKYKGFRRLLWEFIGKVKSVI